jgi:hypothetical protein
MLQAGYIIFQRFLVTPPGGVVLHNPILRLLHSRYVESNKIDSADFLPLNQPGFLKRPNMFVDSRQRQTMLVRQLGHGCRPVGESVDHAAPLLATERFEDAAEAIYHNT